MVGHPCLVGRAFVFAISFLDIGIRVSVSLGTRLFGPGGVVCCGLG